MAAADNTHRRRLVRTTAAVLLVLVFALVVDAIAHASSPPVKGTHECRNHVLNLHVLIKNERTHDITCAFARKLEAHSSYSQPRAFLKPHRQELWTFTYKQLVSSTLVTARHGAAWARYQQFSE